jgi:hypothetical protein
MVAANLTFTQSAVSPGAGISMLGAAGAVVTLSNQLNGNVRTWIYEMLDVPLNSGVSKGVISSGTTPTATFTPDNPATPGCYRVKLTVVGRDGSRSSMIRNFCVQTAQGWILPSFRASAEEMNFTGNADGWETYLNTIFLQISSGVVAKTQISLVASANSSNLGIFTRLGGGIFNRDGYPAGATFTLKAAVQASNSQTYEVRLYDVTGGGYIAGTITDSNPGLETKSLLLTLGAGERIYELMARLTTGSGAADFVRVPSAFIEVVP